MPENRGKTVTAVFTDRRTAATASLWQRDYGQVLIVKGLPLPLFFETRFSLNGSESKPVIGSTENGVGSVMIPDEFLDDNGSLKAYIFLHEGDDDGETEYVITTTVMPQPEVTDEPVTPVQQDVITQAIAALNNAVNITNENVETTNENVRVTEAYRDEAESFKNTAGTAAYNAGVSELNAKTSETNAAGSESRTHGYRNESEGFRDEAEHYADLAEQCAKDAGYLWFYIESGKLYMERTENTEVTFYMENGKLYVKEATA